jgi:hypothetical protein
MRVTQTARWLESQDWAKDWANPILQQPSQRRESQFRIALSAVAQPEARVHE